MTITGTARTEPIVDGLIVGRRPVLDAALEVIGYRLALSSGAEVTPGLLQRGHGLASVFEGRAAFFRPSRSLLLGEDRMPLPLEQTVIEVGPDLAGDRPAVEGVRNLVEDGARVAVHHAYGFDCPEELLEMAHFVLLDHGARREGLAFRLEYEAELSTAIALSAAHGARVVALGVDSLSALKEAGSAGFDLFEGNVLSRPRPVATNAMTPSRNACFQMLQKVNDPETTAAEIERIVETDPGLSYRILHVSGLGAAGGLRREVRSIREAAVLLGREWIQKWLLMMVVADANEGTADQLSVAMVRARMCELLASAVRPIDTAPAFTVGLVSAMDILLGWPLADVVDKLAITPDLKAALLGREGALGDILADVLSWLEWDPAAGEAPLRCGADPIQAERSYLEALDFAAAIRSFLEGAA